ncbi:hypothetical protein NIES4074_40260 [Cylindrospermum sp. NIES-4074]|nr:hypothetical protein NIES4074_40260 [Cylindrospermum sp. NIES-4074]
MLINYSVIPIFDTSEIEANGHHQDQAMPSNHLTGRRQAFARL